MQTFPDNLVRASVHAMTPYVGGKPIEEVQREYNLDKIIKLASNECPIPPSAKVLQIIYEYSRTLHEYPDGNGFLLKQALAKKHNLKPENITLGRGSSEILSLAIECFCQKERGDSLLFPRYSFLVYELLAQKYGLVYHTSELDGWSTDVVALEQSIDEQCRIIFIASPSNPVGTHIDNSVLYEFIKKVPRNTIVLLDQAYSDFVNNVEDTVLWLAEFPNLIITRTFSKAYGLAGLRIGYGLSSKSITDYLNRIRPPFNITSLALAAAEAALDDQESLSEVTKNNERQMKRLEQWFIENDIDWIPSQANFISFRSPIASDTMYQKMLARGVIIRPLLNYGMADYMRVSLGTVEHMDCFYSAMSQILDDGR